MPSLLETDLLPLWLGFNLKYDDNCCSDGTQWDYRILRDACAGVCFERNFEGWSWKWILKMKYRTNRVTVYTLMGGKMGKITWYYDERWFFTFRVREFQFQKQKFVDFYFGYTLNHLSRIYIYIHVSNPFCQLAYEHL